MNNIVPHKYNITLAKRNLLKKHKSLIIWFTGLSGAGKSTLANQVEKALFEKGIHTYTLDGDNIRRGLNQDLGFTEEDRTENLRRIAEVAKLLLDSGTVVLSAFITPLHTDRRLVQDIIGKENYVEVFVHTSLEECEKRDVKGLYRKARTGKIKDFTGINAPYEAPLNPEITIFTENETVTQAVEKIIKYIQPKIRIDHYE